MADVQVFVDIEEAMTNLIANTLQAEVASQTKGLTNDPHQVARVLDDLNLGPAAMSLQRPLELLAANAVLLGAAQFVERKEVRLTYLVQDLEIPEEVELAVDLLVRGLDGSGNDLIRQAGQVALQEAEAADAATPVTGTKGKGLTVGGRALIRKGFGGLAGRINQAVASGTRVQSSISANLTTSRMVTFGALSQATAGGIKTYQWNAQLDGKTCPFCTGMHGKTFSVGVNLKALQQIIRSGDPEVAKAMSPWPRQTIANLNRLGGLSNAKLQEERFSMPPAHPRCRCVASIIGTVPSSEIRGFLKIKPGQGSVRQQLARHRAKPRRVDLAVEADPAAVLAEAEGLAEPLIAEEAALDTEAMWMQRDGEWLTSRVKGTHDPAMAELRAGKQAISEGAEKNFHMLGGGSGAGKGTIQKQGLVRGGRNRITVDSDELKKALKEYRTKVAAGDAEAAAFAHEESSFLAKRAVREGLEDGFDTTLDGTGDGGIAKLTKKVQQARDKGYQVTADYVTIDTDEAVRRALTRAEKSGRLIGEGTIRGIHRQVSRDFRDAIERNLFDEVRLYNNAILDNPILIMEQKAGRTTIFRQDLWDDFLAKADQDIERRILTQADIDNVEKLAKLRAAGKVPLTDARSVPEVVDELKEVSARAILGKRGKFKDLDAATQRKLSRELEEVARGFDEVFPSSIAPEEMFDDLLQGTLRGARFDELTLRGNGVADLTPDAIKLQGEFSSFSFSANVVNDEGVVLAEIRRTFNRGGLGDVFEGVVVGPGRGGPALSVSHDLLEVGSGLQGKGFGKKLLRNQIEFYQKAGVRRIETTASKDVGGYAWARYGFVPARTSWESLKVEISARLKVLSNTLTKRQVTSIQKMLKSDDPRTIWKVSDLRLQVKPVVPGAKSTSEPLGSALLRGAKWFGELDLRDAAAMARTRKYMGR